MAASAFLQGSSCTDAAPRSADGPHGPHGGSDHDHDYGYGPDHDYGYGHDHGPGCGRDRGHG